ncbi:DUF3087 domain-containing protein [Shewanella sp. SR44-3]|uniref:DUF3087 domain-containing protein n=1 Tax=Shewanella sp. SR44-3 TaxID=2760936 RepID=UPI0015F904E5|nr:DUF3087 domain-containing protein [Shewanella sp. SR44-3]MBB1269539.1 DUF3087 domain-containing protein [Shewanella sp. SR44-3]
MNLQQIDKTRYRKRSNLIMMAIVAVLSFSSLFYGAILIHFFGQSALAGAESTGNFQWNLLGVIAGVISSALLMNYFKHHEFLTEAYYVWCLKQLHNQIYRKLIKIKAAAKQDDVNALQILNFYYHSLKQVYLLDDNILTLPKLDADIQQLTEKMQSLGLICDAQSLDRELLKAF